MNGRFGKGIGRLKTFFQLAGPYEGLRVRRLKRFGRIVLDQVINDAAPYWFVTVQGYDPMRDLKIQSRLFRNCRWGNGNWRFVRLSDAEAKFEAFADAPEYQSDEKKRQKRAVQARNQALALRAKGFGFKKQETA
jgi:hypothetical protein